MGSPILSAGQCGVSSWQCPFECGQQYKRSSGRSIRRHVTICFRAHHSDTSALSDEELSAVISEQQDTGRLITGLRRWKLRQPRRRAGELSDDDRWDCVWACGRSYRATSSRSIQQHANCCHLRSDGQTGDVDVKAPRERSQQQRKKRRPYDTFKSPAKHSGDTGVEADGEGEGDSGRSSTANSTPSSQSHPLASDSFGSLTQCRGQAAHHSFASATSPAYVKQDDNWGYAQMTTDTQKLNDHPNDSIAHSATRLHPRSLQQPAHEHDHSQHQDRRRSAQRKQSDYQPYQQQHVSAVPAADQDQMTDTSVGSQQQSYSSSRGWSPFSSSAAAAFLSCSVSSPSSCDSLLSSPPPSADLSWPSSAASASFDVGSPSFTRDLPPPVDPLPPSAHSSAMSAAWPTLLPQCRRPLDSQPWTGTPAAASSGPAACLSSAALQTISETDVGTGSVGTGMAAPSASFTSSSPSYSSFLPPDSGVASPAAAVSSAIASSLDCRSLLTVTLQRFLHEQQRLVSDELCELITALYTRYGMQHPVFQHRIVSPTLLEQALAHNSAHGSRRWID